jgi:ABC-type branched-subunit amino acid transport system ATPase component
MHVATIAGVSDGIARKLEELDAAAVAGLALVTALECTTPRLLLLDRMPPITSEPLRSWLTARTWQLRQAGVAVVQVVSEPGSLLAPAQRLLWVTGGRIVADGHPSSVLEARWRARLGLGGAALGVPA